MPYVNPIPSLDDEPQSKEVVLKFTFQEPVTRKEAAESLTDLFRANPNIIPGQIQLVGDTTLRYEEKQSH